MSRRVVVTGLGCVTPLGKSVKESWHRLLQRDSNGLVKLDQLTKGDFAKWRGIFPPELRVGAVSPIESFEVNSQLFTSQDDRRMSRFIKLATIASYEALVSSGLVNKETKMSEDGRIPIDQHNQGIDPDKVGCLIGSGIGSIEDIYETSVTFDSNTKKNRINPYFVPRILTNMAAGNIAIKFNLRGPTHSVSTACATGNNAIGDGYNMIKLGMQDICLAGASEASVHPLSLAGFLRAKSLSPDGISRPFDEERNGFVLGEGAGIVVLESLESAERRGAPILAEIVGYGLSCDAHHITSPPNDGEGASRAIKMALDLSHGNVNARDIEYVNAHATSTKLGDNTECCAIQNTLIDNVNRQKPLYISSNKGSIGHLLGAAGAAESIFTILSLYNRTIPHTYNLKNVLGNFESSSMRFVKSQPHKVADLEYALCNSFGFGGVNTSLLFRRWYE
ncbi:hypothetical protein B1J92_J02970g [Nakaseomyces glabratus]|nr:hypothetical protein B1J91_J02970g [Nakaseomyces glabratus]OXB47282.1 hypothetical protein B1J92_J02970g [Nakaseomyces glabratus]